MKGTNTLTVNDEQMREIVQKWWDEGTFSTRLAVVVTDVHSTDDGQNFEIVLEEKNLLAKG